MKKKYIFSKDIYMFLIKEYRIFLSMVIGLSISITATLICGNLMMYINSVSENEDGSKYFAINNISKDNTKKVNELIKYLITNNDLEDIFEIFISDSNKSKGNLCGYYCDNDNKSLKNINLLVEGRFFTKQEIKENKKVIIMNQDDLDYNNKLSYIGDNILFDNINYKIVGVQWLVNGSKGAIPYNQYIMKYSFNNIKIEFTKSLDNKKIKLLEQRIREIGLNQKLKYKIKNNEIILYGLFNVIVLAIYILSIINVINLFLFMLKNNKYKNYIYYTCGMSNRDYYLLNVLTILFIGILSMFFGVFIHRCSIPIVRELGIYKSINLIYMITLISLYIMCLIVGGIIAVKKIRITNKLS